MSTCTQRVLLTAAELDVDIELVNVDFSTGEHKSEAHKKYQPFGAVPYLEDTEAGITFFEWVVPGALAEFPIPAGHTLGCLKNLS